MLLVVPSARDAITVAESDGQFLIASVYRRVVVKSITKALLIAGLLVIAVAGTWTLASLNGWLARPVMGGAPANLPRPSDVSATWQQAQRHAASIVAGDPAKQILFGDLHVHTTFSGDAFIRSLPMLNGEGAHPPADACDFARYCSALDFWSINDHAEGISPRMWQETKQAIRQCNAVTEADNPDVVAFLGWEWTQSNAADAASHFGHKNVIFLDTEEQTVPTRPIGSAAFRAIGEEKSQFVDFLLPPLDRIRNPLFDFTNRQLYFDLHGMMTEWAAVPYCEDGVHVRDLPIDCSERAATPSVLFKKLDEWGTESIVIPHGNAWGMTVPPGSSWDHQLRAGNHDPERQILIEIYSGHGNSEQYRPWRAVGFDENGKAFCPEPGNGYTPSCWRAGEIITERCRAAGFDEEECETRAARARRDYLSRGNLGFHTIPGQRAQDWSDAGQCRDCFLPVFNLRPGYSTQYALSISNLDNEGKPRRFRFGLIGSSDSHRGRPGVGYKEFSRHGMTDAHGPASPAWESRLKDDPGEPLPKSLLRPVRMTMLNFSEFERRAGFLTTGGLVATHAEGRDRDAIWAALKRKEVYATSGPRILLWFDLLNANQGELPMGSNAELTANPRFRVRAVGSFKQKPGCPEHSLTALGPDGIARVCRGECYNPSDERYAITRIEVVRIRPQMVPDEPVDDLIEEQWRMFDCEPDPGGCIQEFEDAEFADAGRDAVYYVRAIQEPTPKVNGGNLRCEYDEDGNCVKMNICYGGYRTDRNDDCLWDVEERAWSSPLFVDYRRP
jgi:hypothetical protein